MTSFKVLVPLDGSRPAEHSLAFVPALAHLGKVHIDLVAVVDVLDEAHGLTVPEAAERETNVLSTYLREVAGDIQKHLGMTAETRVVAGNPATAILDAAASISPDLLVMSTHGRTGIARLRRGSVADKVIRGSVCPILVVGPKAMEKGQWLEAEAVPPFQSILVPLDGSRPAEGALAVAIKFVNAFHSRLHLFRAVPVPLSSPGMMTESVYGGRYIDEMVGAAESYLADVRASTELPSEVVTRVRVGSPTFLIEEYVSSTAIDLVVMTTHGRGGVIRTALGSVTDHLIDAGPPVLIVPSQERIA